MIIKKLHNRKFQSVHDQLIVTLNLADSLLYVAFVSHTDLLLNCLQSQQLPKDLILLIASLAFGTPDVPSIDLKLVWCELPQTMILLQIANEISEGRLFDQFKEEESAKIQIEAAVRKNKILVFQINDSPRLIYGDETQIIIIDDCDQNVCFVR